MENTRKWKWEKHHLTSPVTSVEFVGSDQVLSGNGPYITLHSVTDGVLLSDKNLLPRSRIHGIRVEQKYGNLVVIFGQKVIRAVRLQGNGSNFNTSFEAASDIVSFPDLIWDTHWLYDKEEGPTHVAIATAHNAVWIWEWERNVKQLVAQCEEPCILYSAKFFGSHLDDLVLASGTVFNQILLWKVQGWKDGDNKTTVLERLTGHEGVIFSINFNKQGTLLSSVSDDRSIRLWKVSNLLTYELNGSVESLLVVYGHTARVWDAKLLETCFVSIGEDLVCNVWSYEGNVLKVYKGHTGRNIWSLAVNQTEDLIATGGGDGSIRLWPLSSPDLDKRSIVKEAYLPFANNSTQENTGSQKAKKEDYPRFVCLLDEANLLVMTNQGCLYKYDWLKNIATNRKVDVLHSNTDEMLNLKDEWTLLLRDAEYSSYSVVALSPCHKIISFGNLKGTIKLQDTDFLHPCVELDAYSGKVHSLLWNSQDSPCHLFSCGPGGQITWWNVRLKNNGEPIFDVTPLCSFVLPPCKQRWASAVEIFPNHSTEQITDKDSLATESFLVVCGDRRGSLHLFDPKNWSASSGKPIPPAYSLPLIHGKAGVSHVCVRNNIVYSAGRDGVYRQLRVHSSALEVIDTKKVFKGFDWVEKLLFTNSGDLIIAGFHAAYFVLWSVQRNELLWRVKCGGAHRVWDLTLEQSDVSTSGAVLSFIKESTICTHKISFPSEVNKAVLKASFHGREATCICHIDSFVGQEGDIKDVFATGSEDTNIKLLISSRSTGLVSPVFTAHGHISSIRALSVAKRPLLQHSKTGGHLLFSGGGRASLKCFRVDLSIIDINSDDCHGDKVTSSPMVFLGEYSFHFSNHRRRRKKHDLQSLSEIRFMSLTSLSAVELLDASHQLIDSCQSLYFVMAACSDGFVRVFAFDEQQNKFLLVAQSHYLKRCVLTVNHVTDFLANGRPLVMLFAGDTAGKISGWDVTALLLNHMKERCGLASEEDESFTKVSKTECRMNSDVGKLTIKDERTVNEPSETRSFKEHVSCDVASERVTSYTVEKSLPTVLNNRVKCFESGGTKDGDVSCDVDCRVSDAEIETGATPTGGTETNHCEGQILGNKTDGKKHATVANDTQNQSRLEEPQCNEKTNISFEEQSDHSCLPLVRIFLDPPSHVFQAHQSGVNAVSLTKTQVRGQYLLVSGGDDSALYAAEFGLMLDDNNITKVHVLREVAEASAHTSSVTGVKALKNGSVVSSSVDQRIVVWDLVNEEQVSSPSFSFHHRAAEVVDIPDVQDMEVWCESNDCIVAAVCGVGLQTLRLVEDS